jgi:hypothetical protein
MQTVTMAFLIGSFKLLLGLATRFQGALGPSAFGIERLAEISLNKNSILNFFNRSKVIICRNYLDYVAI